MSLINQMLKDLDTRRSDAGSGNLYGSQVRAVSERRGGVHPAWWVVLIFGACLIILLGWILLRAPVAGDAAPVAQISPRLEARPDEVQPTEAETPPALEAPDEVSASIPGDLPATAQSAPVEAIAPVTPPDTDRMPTAVISQPAAPKSALSVSRPALSIQPDLPAPPIKVRAAPPPAPLSVVPSQSVETPIQAAPVTMVQSGTPPVSSPSLIPAQGTERPAPADFAKQVHELTAAQRAENEFRKATFELQSGRQENALVGLEQALVQDPTHSAARQTMIAVLLDSKRLDDALVHARIGQELDPRDSGLAIIFARLQLERGDLRGAIETLERTRPHALERADYLAFLAALLQRDERHRQASEHYLLALQRTPQNGVWWMGLGISLQAEQRQVEALEAFQRAKTSNSLSPELLAFVDTRLAQLGKP